MLGRLAVGGMAEILLCRERAANVTRGVVIKRLLPHVALDADLVRGFVHEAGLAMRLRHPGICALYEQGEQGGVAYLAIEWVHGVSLQRLITRVREQGARVPLAIALRIVADVCEALHHAHTARDENGKPLGIVHRDVTPENIMVGFDGVVKLLDFGIAKASSQQQKTQSGELKGKFAYMSPEQYQGQTLDGRSDLFSVGVCLFEALTSERLFARASEMETVAAIMFADEAPGPRDVTPDVPKVIDSLVRRALAKDPADRWPTALAMQGAIEAWLAEEKLVVPAAEVAAWAGGIFPEEVTRLPKLEKTLIAPLDASKTGANPRQEADNTLERMLLAAEADEEMDDLAKSQRWRRRAIVFAVVAIVLATVGALAVTGNLPGVPGVL